MILFGARDRALEQRRLGITAGFIAGVYSQTDLTKAPGLNELMGEAQAVPSRHMTPEEAQSNADKWINIINAK